MTMCPNSKHACRCQPQEGVMCPHGPTPKDWPGVTENIDAERVAFEAAMDGQLDFCRQPGAEYFYAETGIAWEAWQAARRTSAPIGEEGVHKLPRPIIATRHGTPAYTVGQMLDYAREAVAADRRAREVSHLVEMAQWARDNGLTVPPQWAAAPPLSSDQQADFRALVQSIIHDGYLSETNMQRGRRALNITSGE